MYTTIARSDGDGTIVRLPREFAHDGQELCVKKLGHMITLVPQDKVWDVFRDGLARVTDDFMAGPRMDEPPHERNWPEAL